MSNRIDPIFPHHRPRTEQIAPARGPLEGGMIAFGHGAGQVSPYSHDAIRPGLPRNEGFEDHAYRYGQLVAVDQFHLLTAKSQLRSLRARIDAFHARNQSLPHDLDPETLRLHHYEYTNETRNAINQLHALAHTVTDRLIAESHFAPDVKDADRNLRRGAAYADLHNHLTENADILSEAGKTSIRQNLTRLRGKISQYEKNVAEGKVSPNIIKRDVQATLIAMNRTRYRSASIEDLHADAHELRTALARTPDPVQQQQCREFLAEIHERIANLAQPPHTHPEHAPLAARIRTLDLLRQHYPPGSQSYQGLIADRHTALDELEALQGSGRPRAGSLTGASSSRRPANPVQDHDLDRALALSLAEDPNAPGKVRNRQPIIDIDSDSSASGSPRSSAANSAGSHHDEAAELARREQEDLDHAIALSIAHSDQAMKLEKGKAPMRAADEAGPSNSWVHFDAEDHDDSPLGAEPSWLNRPNHASSSDGHTGNPFADARPSELPSTPTQSGPVAQSFGRRPVEPSSPSPKFRASPSASNATRISSADSTPVAARVPRDPFAGIKIEELEVQRDHARNG